MAFINPAERETTEAAVADRWLRLSGEHGVSFPIKQPARYRQGRRRRILNPKTARSQVIGAMTMGVGAALMEEPAVDTRDGFLVKQDLAGSKRPPRHG